MPKFLDLPQLLHPTSPLPIHIDLGQSSCSWQGGEFEYTGRQDGFRRLTREEVVQLMRKLHVAPHLLLLNLESNASVGGQLHVCLSVLTNLQVLGLRGTCARGLGFGFRVLEFRF